MKKCRSQILFEEARKGYDIKQQLFEEQVIKSIDIFKDYIVCEDEEEKEKIIQELAYMHSLNMKNNKSLEKEKAHLLAEFNICSRCFCANEEDFWIEDGLCPYCLNAEEKDR